MKIEKIRVIRSFAAFALRECTVEKFESRRTPRTRSLKGFLCDLSALRGQKAALVGFSDSLVGSRQVKDV
ncbi:MAG: hypothetical protein ACOY0R_06265, partial [Chloroflexota bacterium]